MVITTAQKVTKHLGYFASRICYQEIPNFALSGHTASTDSLSLAHNPSSLSSLYSIPPFPSLPCPICVNSLRCAKSFCLASCQITNAFFESKKGKSWTVEMLFTFLASMTKGSRLFLLNKHRTTFAHGVF